MNERHLHIISFIVPYPVNYGGVFDIFYKIVALHSAGVKIHLHCFTSGNKQEPELNKFCEEVFYYPRKRGITGVSLSLPYIVSSRINDKLNERLSADNYPVLIEGIHSAGWLLKKQNSTRRIFLRLLNVEHQYYWQLFLTSSSISKKLYFLSEAALLKRFEKSIAHIPSLILAFSQQDLLQYRRQFKVDNIDLLPPFTGFSNHTPPIGRGKYCLYHGKLSVPENERAVIWLLQEVFDKIEVPFIVAGSNPSSRIQKSVTANPRAKLVPNPSDDDMQQLLADAQCNVLPSFNVTGVKLKIINALFHSRHCIVNSAAVAGSGMETLCHVANSGEDFVRTVNKLINEPLKQEDILSRKKVLDALFNDDKNCEKLIRLIW